MLDLYGIYSKAIAWTIICGGIPIPDRALVFDVVHGID